MGQLLVGLGCVSATLALVRGITLLFARRGGTRLVEAVVGYVSEDETAKAEALLASRSNPTARVLGTILDAADRSKEELDRVVEESLLRELPRIDRFASALIVITGTAAVAQANMQPVNDLPNPYQTVEGWAKLPAGRTWGATSAVEVDKDGRSIWVGERCGANSCLDRTTNQIQAVPSSARCSSTRRGSRQAACSAR